MVHGGSGARLLAEHLQRGGIGRQITRQELDRNGPLELLVPRAVHDAHPAPADLFAQVVALGVVSAGALGRGSPDALLQPFDADRHAVEAVVDLDDLLQDVERSHRVSRPLESVRQKVQDLEVLLGAGRLRSDL